MFMPSTNDFLVVNSGGALNRICRFNFTTGAFVSYYINSSGTTSNLNSPQSIILGPDGNYWITSSNGTNKITRFNITTGAKINDPFLGVSRTAGHHEQQYESDRNYLFVANGSGNNIIAYDAYQYAPQAVAYTGNGPSPAPASTGDGFEFVPQGPQGLTNPKNILFVQINDPPSAGAGADQSASPGQVVTLSGTGSDPENLPLTYQWTQLSGTPVLSGSLLTSGGVNSPSLGFIAPNSGGPLVFQLTVSDGVKSATDTIIVTISGPPAGVVPVLTLQAADGLTSQRVTLHGTVNLVAGSAAYRFEYGPVSLDMWTAVQTVSSSQAVVPRSPDCCPARLTSIGSGQPTGSADNSPRREASPPSSSNGRSSWNLRRPPS